MNFEHGQTNLPTMGKMLAEDELYQARKRFEKLLQSFVEETGICLRGWEPQLVNNKHHRFLVQFKVRMPEWNDYFIHDASFPAEMLLETKDADMMRMLREVHQRLLGNLRATCRKRRSEVVIVKP